MLLPCSDCHREWVFFGLINVDLLSHQHETWSKLSCKVYSTCIISVPDVWSVVSSANMSQATEIFVTSNDRSLIKNTKQNRPYDRSLWYPKPLLS